MLVVSVSKPVYISEVMRRVYLLFKLDIIKGGGLIGSCKFFTDKLGPDKSAYIVPMSVVKIKQRIVVTLFFDQLYLLLDYPYVRILLKISHVLVCPSCFPQGHQLLRHKFRIYLFFICGDKKYEIYPHLLILVGELLIPFRKPL